MNKIVKIVISTLIGTGCFGAGLYYATLEFYETLDNIMGEYEVISEQVDAFVDISNPETIRFYTTELRKLLDDIKFLHVLIESGQIADEKLDDYLASQQSNVDVLEKTLSSITVEVDSMLTSSHDHMHLMVEELQDSVKTQLIHSTSQVTSKVDDLSGQLSSFENKLDDVNKVIEKIKNSKMSKYLK
jgi:cell division septum initiation protein DivIVA